MPDPETYEQAAARTGRKYPFRTADWPCPACGKAECDRDVEIAWRDGSKYVYAHIEEREATQ